MALGILIIGTVLGFGMAVIAGLVFGLNFLGVLGVYCIGGFAISLAGFMARGIWCGAARMRETFA